MRSFRLMRTRPVMAALGKWAPLRAATAQRALATAAPAPLSEEEKKRLIEKFPYKWPWGQTIEVVTPKKTFKVTISQTHPAPSQHKLAYKIDATPPDVPKRNSVFLGPHGKTAHKIFNAAQAAGTLDATKAALDAFVGAYDADGKAAIKTALMNPRTLADDKAAFLTQALASAGADATTTAEVVDLFKQKKLHKIGEVKKYFATLLSEHRKERHGAIISAEPLSEKSYDAISAKMQKLVAADEKLILSREIEPSIVGGFIIRIGSLCQDLSVSSQITRMEKHLKQFFSKNKDAADKVLV